MDSQQKYRWLEPDEQVKPAHWIPDPIWQEFLAGMDDWTEAFIALMTREEVL